MEINRVVLNNNLFRFSLYRKNQSDQYVIFLLGALQNIESVDFFSCRFSSQLNCLTVELPGTGRTTPLNSTISIQEQARMLVDLIDYMEINRAHIIAFSYATAIAVEMCKIWPSVVTMSICAGVPGIPTAARYTTKRAVAVAIEKPQEFASLFTNSLTIENEDIPRNRAILRMTKRSISKYNSVELDMFIENTIRLLVYSPSGIDDIKIPCVICIGEYDPYVTIDDAMFFSNQLSNGYLKIIKNADHLVHLEYPEKVADTMIILAESVVGFTNKIRIS